MKTKFIFQLLLLLCLLLPSPVLEAEFVPFKSPAVRKRNPVFLVPRKLRPRVDFWIDIFTKYGKHERVIHHRDFPQAVFMVVDFSREAEKYSPRSLKKYQKNKLKQYFNEIKKALKYLAAGRLPRTELQRRIADEMSFLGIGTSKYKRVLKDNLIRSQSGIKEKYAEAIRRSGKYLHIIEDIFVRDNGLPIELTRLPFVESSFDYKAYSAVGAAGIWQFMRRTGRYYMKVNNLVDERRDIIAATRGAVKYLRSAYEKLGNWPLALTSYNHGVAGVSRKVKKFGSKDIVKIVEHPTKRVFGFASTNFYPEFLASLDVYDNYQKYFPGIRREAPMRIAQRKLSHATSVSYISKQVQIPVDELKAVNYAISSSVWKGYYRIPKGYTIKVPAQYGSRLATLRLPEPGAPKAVTGTSSIYGGVVYKVRKGDTLSRIARKYRTSVAKLRSYNGLRSDLVKVGQLLVVKPRESSSGSVTAKVQFSVTTYKVRRGDTLSGIARQFGTSVSKLREINHLKSSRLSIGQVLKVRKAAPVRTKVTQTKASTYRVRKGDTLSSIAKRHGTTVSKLKSLNGLRSSRIRIGQVLRVSVSASKVSAIKMKVTKYRVKRGESLWSISKKLGVRISDLKRVNNMRSSKIKVGQVLIVP